MSARMDTFVGQHAFGMYLENSTRMLIRTFLIHLVCRTHSWILSKNSRHAVYIGGVRFCMWYIFMLYSNISIHSSLIKYSENMICADKQFSFVFPSNHILITEG